jgi:hypothetical protein
VSWNPNTRASVRGKAGQWLWCCHLTAAVLLFEGGHALRVLNISAGTQRDKVLELFSVARLDFCKCTGCSAGRTWLSTSQGRITESLRMLAMSQCTSSASFTVQELPRSISSETENC